MFVRILGSAAGGGYPQWNCACPNCRRLRAGDPRVRRRTNDSLAISADGRSWMLINASPDISAQIESFAALHPGPGIRSTPIRGILLTDAELDHTLGLLHLRQGAEMDVYATRPVLNALSGPFPVRHLLEPFAKFHWREAAVSESFPLFGEKLWITPLRLGGKPPRYLFDSARLEDRPGDQPWVVGYRLWDAQTGGVTVYAPGVESWSEELEKHLQQADCVLLDGTFWQSDELQVLSAAGLAAADMGHVPLTGPGGSLSRIARLTASRKVLIHLNNTNPILVGDSEAGRTAAEYGIEVGYDGWEVEV